MSCSIGGNDIEIGLGRETDSGIDQELQCTIDAAVDDRLPDCDERGTRAFT